MRKILIVVGFIMLVLSGCAGLSGGGEEEKRVRTLGVVPILVDADSIDYSARAELTAMLVKSAANIDNLLVEQLRKKGDYFDVRLIDVPYGNLYEQIVIVREKAGEGDASYNAYAYNPEMVTRLANDNLVDAVLVVVINGITRSEKRWKEGPFSLDFLEADYRSLLYSAAVVAPPSEQLWVREHRPGSVFLRLDYPDFSEAYWNKTEQVRIKEVTLSGLERTLLEPETGSTTSRVYNDMVRDLVGDLKRGM